MATTTTLVSKKKKKSNSNRTKQKQKNLPTGMSSGTLAVSQSDSAISSLANHRASPSRSETDGMTIPRQRTQRRTKSEDDVGTVDAQVVEIVGRNSPIDDSEGDVEYLDMDFMPSSAGETTTDSVDVSADFKKPRPAAKKQQPAAKVRENPVTRRRQRRAHNADSDFSDDNN